MNAITKFLETEKHVQQKVPDQTAQKKQSAQGLRMWLLFQHFIDNYSKIDWKIPLYQFSMLDKYVVCPLYNEPKL